MLTRAELEQIKKYLVLDGKKDKDLTQATSAEIESLLVLDKDGDNKQVSIDTFLERQIPSILPFGDINNALTEEDITEGSPESQSYDIIFATQLHRFVAASTDEESPTYFSHWDTEKYYQNNTELNAKSFYYNKKSLYVIDITNENRLIPINIGQILAEQVFDDDKDKTQSAINQDLYTRIENLVGLSFESVDELPNVETADVNKIYLVPVQEGSDVKDAYIVDGTVTKSWKKIWSTAIDISNYVTTETFNNTITPIRNDINTVNQAIDVLEDAVFPINIALTASLAKNEYTGLPKDVTVSWSITRSGGMTVNLTDLTITNLDNVPVQTSGTLHGQTTKLGTTTYTLTAKVNKKTLTKTSTVTTYLPTFIGFLDNGENSTALEVTESSGVSKKVTSSASGISGSYSNTLQSAYLYIATPDNIIINSIKSSGFDVPFTLVRSNDGTIQIPSGTVRTYRVYRTASKVNQGSMSIVVS